ncbi:peptidoglycan-binding protein [Streptomyces sp. NPDC057654]|uniref:peptidoglycan-binding protein n=1 Tax=Streptomyces sp. NPDC057654 TaxID=3346196 RepID=UPI00368ECDCD
MATPLTADVLVAALKAEGVRVVEHSGWRTHNRNHKGPWGPVNGVIIHHTVTSGTESSVEMCFNGYDELPGPLCHGVIAKDGTVHLVGNGRANHAGKGDGSVLNAVIRESALPRPTVNDTDGNTRFYGFECVNLGDGADPWPAAQLAAIERVSAAVCRAHGWSSASVIGHKEWTNNKIDPRGFSMADMRSRVAGRLKGEPSGGDGSAEPDTYTVRPGDTLSSIAAAFHTTVEILMALNGITDPNRIQAGQTLKIPGADTPRYAPFPGEDFFRSSPRSPLITAMGRRLVAEGCSAYEDGPGPQWSAADRESFRKWQRKLGDAPEFCDGWPGRRQWDALKVPYTA